MYESCAVFKQADHLSIEHYVTRCTLFCDYCEILRNKHVGLFKIVPSLLNGIRVAAFAWYSVKIRVIFGVRFERRKVDKKANLHGNWNMQTLFWCLLNISAKFHQNWSLQFWAIPFQSCAFFETQCIVVFTSILTYRWRREIYGWNMQIAVLQIHQFQLDFHTDAT